MAGSSPLDRYFHLGNQLVAKYGRTVDMDVYNVTYDATGSRELVAKNIQMRIDPAGARTQALPAFPGVNYFVVFGPKNLLKAGHLLIPSKSDGFTPAVTIIQNVPTSDVTAIRTGQVGQITDGTDLLYDNVYYDFYTFQGPEGMVEPEFIGSTRMETNKAIIFYRPEILIDHQFILSSGKRFQIVTNNTIGNQTSLMLRREPR